jgi:hypothetical protein
MPQLQSARVRISRQTVQLLWWTYAGGLFTLGILTLAVTSARRSGLGEWSPPLAVVLALAMSLGFLAHRLMAVLPEAGHPLFDTVGERFEMAMRHLFVRFVLAGGAATGAGVLGAVLLALGGPSELGMAVVGGGLALLVRLRRRVSPLVHYLA